MPHKNLKAIVNPVDISIVFFDIVIVVLEAERLTPYMIIICMDNIRQKSIDLKKLNDFTLKIDKKQAISFQSYGRHRLRRWLSTIPKKYILKQISSTFPGASLERQGTPRDSKKKRLHVL